MELWYSMLLAGTGGYDTALYLYMAMLLWERLVLSLL
jgi:hypothetical protein